MVTRLSYNELKIVSYTQRHDVSHFESKTADLNSFLKDDAFENQEELISKTYLCCHSDQLVGYIIGLHNTKNLGRSNVKKEINLADVCLG